MYICSGVHIHRRTYVPAYIFTRIHICTGVHMFICTYVHAYRCTGVYMHKCTYVHVYRRTYGHAYRCPGIYMHTRTYVHMYRRTYGHAYSVQAYICTASKTVITNYLRMVMYNIYHLNLPGMRRKQYFSSVCT